MLFIKDAAIRLAPVAFPFVILGKPEYYGVCSAWTERFDNSFCVDSAISRTAASNAS